MGLFETIKYKVVKKERRIEIREYEDILLASTRTVFNNARDTGFSNVFNYISGDNLEKAKISMTTPVVTYEEEGKLVTGFYVPSKYSEENIPKPSNEKVFISKMNKSFYGVIRFSGRWTDKNFDHYDNILVDYLLDNQYEILSARIIMRYQPPFIPAFLRRNEIAYQVRLKNAK